MDSEKDKKVFAGGGGGGTMCLPLVFGAQKSLFGIGLKSKTLLSLPPIAILFRFSC